MCALESRIDMEVCVCGVGLNTYVHNHMNPENSLHFHMQITFVYTVYIYIPHMLYQLHIIQLCFTQIAFWNTETRHKQVWILPVLHCFFSRDSRFQTNFRGCRPRFSMTNSLLCVWVVYCVPKSMTSNLGEKKQRKMLQNSGKRP